MIYPLIRVIAVIALVGIAGALATPPGRLPLALRGVLKIMKKDRGLNTADLPREAPLWKRILAFILVLIAAGIALI